MLDTTDRIIKHGTGPLDPAGEGGVEALFGRARRRPDPAARVDDATGGAVI